MSYDIYENLINEFIEQRNAIKIMILELEKIKEKIDSLFGNSLDKRYMRFFEEKIKSVTELFKTILDMRKEIIKNAKDEFELTPLLDMKGIPTGNHNIKVEMYELWSSGEKLLQTFKTVTVDYIPINRESRLVKVPCVRSVIGADLAVVSELEKDLYRDIEKTTKKEQLSKRDDW